MVAAELGRLQERERFLERELRTAQSNPDLASVQLDEQALTRLLGEETARVLTTARESAAEIRQKAEQSAAQLLNEASDEAARMREEAEVEASRRRTDAATDAEAELAMAKQQGREMVNEARAYRERVLSELARRRELAREQIEQLLHGRDRLMQSFERARLVAVDVVAELQPLGEPDEYVNLSPTTGPVPVMVPNSPRPDAPSSTPSTEQPLAGEAADDQIEDAVEDTATVEDTDAVEDTETVEDIQTVDAATDVETAHEVAEAEAVDEVEAVDDATAVVELEVVEDVADVADDAVADVAGDDTEPSDDVVVDLFARLRADTSLVAVDDGEPDDAELGDAELDDGELGDAEPDDGELSEVPDVAAEPIDRVDQLDADGEPADGEAELGEVTPFDQRDADLTPLIVASAKKLKRILADEQNEVLDGLRRREPVRELADLLPSPSEHFDRYRGAIVDDLLAAATAGASSVAPGRVTRLKKADARKATAAGEAVLDEWLIVPLRERLERCVADGDGDNVGIAKRARSVYREWKTQHIDEQLDDVIRAAHGCGAFTAIETGAAVQWVADPSHDVCADCDDNTLGGTVAAGDAVPTGHLFPPAHLGCRCLLLPADR